MSKFDTEIDQKIRILSLSANCLLYIGNTAKLKYEYNIPENVIIEMLIKKLVKKNKKSSS